VTSVISEMSKFFPYADLKFGYQCFGIRLVDFEFFFHCVTNKFGLTRKHCSKN
jgi:hypothetical protein